MSATPQDSDSSPESHKSSDPIGWVRNHLLVVIAIFALVGGLIGWFCTTVYQRNVDNDGIARQRNVLTLYNQFGSSLSTCLDTTRISSQIAQKEFDGVKDILKAALSARYEGSATSISTASPIGGQLISSLQERYPDIDVSIWKQVVSTAIGCRNQVNGMQQNFQAYAGDFDTWRQQGDIFSHNVRAKFPTDALTVTSPTQGTLKGMAAFTYMTRVLTTAEAGKALDSGVMPDQQLFPSSSPTG